MQFDPLWPLGWGRFCTENCFVARFLFHGFVGFSLFDVNFKLQCLASLRTLMSMCGEVGLNVEREASILYSKIC